MTIQDKIVAFLRSEADAARHAQQHAAIDSPDKLYRMGQKDGLLLAADAIERGHYTAMRSIAQEPAHVSTQNDAETGEGS